MTSLKDVIRDVVNEILDELEENEKNEEAGHYTQEEIIDYVLERYIK